MTPDERFALVRPRPCPPAAPPPWFRPVSIAGGHAYLSGQVPFDADGRLLAVGRLGAEVDLATGVRCARQCAVNLLAVLARTPPGLAGVDQLLKLTVFVACAPDFTAQPEVANGASELLAEVLGEHGAHARSAIGVASLPLGAPVEIELIARLR
ncbi:RidA family protein [Micromonospora echinofusca]|uniref:RidA family protein n=1 Tax=Micromonospora echinofusca TaxID=47858 RepID=UPI001AD77950|nr:RidA family protein [Micromonospora echinofusca]